MVQSASRLYETKLLFPGIRSIYGISGSIIGADWSNLGYGYPHIHTYVNKKYWVSLFQISSMFFQCLDMFTANKNRISPEGVNDCKLQI